MGRMRRGWKLALAALAVIALLLALNAVVTARDTKPAEATVEGGRILDLPGGALQAVEHGPRRGAPIVLLHCYTCAIDWWDRIVPRLSGRHRVIALDMLGHGGSEKPRDGYRVDEMAAVVAQALDRLQVRQATVIGHSMGGAIAVALAEQAPRQVERVAILDTRSSPEDEGDLGVLARLGFAPVIGPALWRLKTDFVIRKGLEVAFAPGYDVPDEFVADVRRMNYNAYSKIPYDFDDYTQDETLGERYAATGKPLLVVMGAEEQLIEDPAAALRSFKRDAPAAQTVLMPGAGHSPNVERPALTAALLRDFASGYSPANAGLSR